MKESKMEITSIEIQPNDNTEAQIKATAEVILNGSLALRGIKILQGRYGLFLAFPGLQVGTPYRVFETLSMRFRMEMQSRVLESYRDCIQSPRPIFR